jgi:hypothetical protein
MVIYVAEEVKNGNASKYDIEMVGYNEMYNSLSVYVGIRSKVNKTDLCEICNINNIIVNKYEGDTIECFFIIFWRYTERFWIPSPHTKIKWHIFIPLLLTTGGFMKKLKIYRAKRYNSNKWIYKCSVTNNDLTITNKTINIVPSTICRCSFKKDCKGKYTFENDIIQNNKSKHVFIIKFGKCLPWMSGKPQIPNFYVKNILDEMQQTIKFSSLETILSTSTIIGNTIDNAELLSDQIISLEVKEKYLKLTNFNLVLS